MSQPLLVAVDHLFAALARLAQQYKGKPNFASLFAVLARQVQDIETAIAQLYTGRTLADAVGAQLGMLERVVGQRQFVFSDDAVRKAWIGARILLNHSSGTGDDLLNILKAVLPSPLVPVLDEKFPAGFDMRVAGGALPDELLEPVARMVQLGKAAGVGHRFLWQGAADADVFTFADPDYNSRAILTVNIPAGSIDPFVIRNVYGPWLAFFTGSFDEFLVTVDPTDAQGHFETVNIVSVGSYGGGYYIVPDGGWAQDHDAGEEVIVSDVDGNEITTEGPGKGFADESIPGSGGQFASARS